MSSKLKNYFPLLRDREEIMQEIHAKPGLLQLYQEWSREQQESFLNFCTGNHGLKILYDAFLKEILNPEYDPSRLESLLSVLLKRKVKIRQILANDSTRIASETSLLVTDIIVALEDGSLANVEIQRIGYAFPGARSACYSADMLLRQYRRLRSDKEKTFSYGQIKNVYLIVIFERSPTEFKAFPHTYFHHACQKFDTGLQINLMQEYIMIPLDIFHKNMQNKFINTPLEAWLTFLSEDDPERIIELITKYPEFKAMYNTLYGICRNMERVMEMFSEELKEMDRNTVLYMIEEQQKELELQKAELAERDCEIERLRQQIEALERKALQD